LANALAVNRTDDRARRRGADGHVPFRTNAGSLDIDTGFATTTGFDTSVYSIAPANDGSGDVFVGGAFSSYNATRVDGIVRLDPDGSVD